MSERPVYGNRWPAGESPASDFLYGEVQARLLISAIERGIAGPDALAVTLRDLLASKGRAIPPSHRRRGFCLTLQQQLQKQNAPGRERFERQAEEPSHPGGHDA